MRKIAVVIAALALVACTAEEGRVAEVLACSQGSSWGNSPKCRVLLESGKRATVFAPVVAGDRVILKVGYRYWLVRD